MTEHVLIRIAPPGRTGCSWLLGDGTVEHGSLTDAAISAAQRRAIVLVPGPEVLLTHAAIPAAKSVKARVAAPWAVEDRLLSEVQDLHFALGHNGVKGMWPMAIIARQRLDAHLSACRAAGLEPAAVIPEPLALPSPREGAWSVLEEPGRVTVRMTPATGFACEPEMLGIVAAACEPPELLDRRVVTGADAQNVWPRGLAEAVKARDPTTLPEALTAFDQHAAINAIDLLQGQYSRHEHTARALRRWRWPALVGGALVAALIAEGAIRYATLGQEQRALREQIEATFRQAFPEVERVVDPRAQTKTRLAKLRDAGNAVAFTDLLWRAGSIIKQAEGVELGRVMWRDGTLEVGLQAGDLQILDTVKRQLREAGLDAELTGANSSGDRVSGQIRVLAARGDST